MGDGSRAGATGPGDERSARALVVDDDAFTRTLVANLVSALGFVVCGSAGSATDAMRLAIEHRPEVAVLDLDLGEGPTGIDLATGLRRNDPGIALVMLSSYQDPLWAGVRREAPRGARWVLKSDVDDAQILEREIVAALERPLAPAPRPSSNRRAPISEPQMEVLRLVAAGYTNAEIARRRSLTVDAVNKAISRLVRQLGITVGDSANARVMLVREYHRMTRTVSDRRD